MMTAGTKMEESGNRIEGHEEGITAQGMVLGHAYSILDLIEIKG